MSDISEMYDNNENDTPAIPYDVPAKVTDKGKYREVVIDGETLIMVKPAVIAAMERSITAMQTRISRLENEMKQAAKFQRAGSQAIKQIAEELSTKISYD